ncbi:glutamate receptor ionotropic, NMDA 2B-like [Rhopilema esculentum]|uniref:glutamate receptor ionotropic, NMDA 2B-like n=1 Tax=Rhopilema esculentum TaxID=499914 RepID=UPI0031DA1270
MTTLKIFLKSTVASLWLLSAIRLSYMLEYDVTTFVNSSLISNITSSKAHNFTFSNTRVRFQYELIKGSAGLSNIVDILSRQQDISRNSTVLRMSYVGEQIENIITEVLSSKKEKLHPLQPGNCSQISDEAFDVPSPCKRFKDAYLYTFKTLINEVFVKPVMLVTDEQDPCVKNIANTLSKISDDGLFVQKVGSTRSLVKDITEAVNKAITTSTSTIILLCSNHISELILARSISHPALKDNVIWVTVSSNIKKAIVPTILLNVEFEENKASLLPSLNKDSIMLLAAKKVVSLSVESKRLSRPDAILMTKKAVSEFKALCNERSSTEPLASVSFRLPNHQWQTMYRLSGKGKLTLLSRDSKISWLSRTNFHKQMLTVVTVEDPPFVEKASNKDIDRKTRSCTQGLLCRFKETTSNGTTWERTCCVGLMMDLLKRLQKDLSLSIDLYLAEDGYYGSFENNTWNGMIRDLIIRKAEMIMGPITATESRSAVVDVGEPMFHISLAILLLQQYETELSFLNFSFVNNVDGDLLLVLLAMFLFGFCFIYLLENTLFSKKDESSKRSYNLKDGFAYVSGITFQRDLGGKSPKKSSARISFVVFAFAMVIIMSTYTATLTAVKVKQENLNVFEGMHDPKFTNPTNDFKFATIASTSVAEYFRRSTSEHFRRMFTFMKKYNLKSTREGAMKVLNGELQAFIMEYPMAQYYAGKQKDCRLKVIPTNHGKGTWNVFFSRGSSWNGLISRKILEYKEKAILASDYERWMHSKCSSETGTTVTNHKFTITHFGGLVVILSLSFLASLVVLMFEKLFFMRKECLQKYSLHASE